ncbi:MAG: glycosyltransferase family 4 protein [Gammaproteobacteria bacterium]
MFTLMDAMRDTTFVPFCVRFSENRETEYSGYFVDPPGKGVYFKDFDVSLADKLRVAADQIYSWQSRQKLDALLRAVKPDIAYFLNAVYFTDSIVDACASHGVPVVWRMSDFNKVCASYHFYRDGAVCEECIHDGILRALKNRCGGNQRSMAAAAVKVAAMSLSRVRNVYSRVARFVTPSEFTRGKMIQGGFRADRIEHIPTPAAAASVPASSAGPERILFVGRITPEKGLDVLIRAFSRLDRAGARLQIVGDYKSDYAQSLIDAIDPAIRGRVDFLGFRNQEEIETLYRQCSFFVVPSVWYENLPNVLLEGMAQGRPVIASRLGSLVEFVRDGHTGFHFQAGDDVELADRMQRLLDSPPLADRMGLEAWNYVKAHHAPDVHIAKLRAVFESAIAETAI